MPESIKLGICRSCKRKENVSDSKTEKSKKKEQPKQKIVPVNEPMIIPVITIEDKPIEKKINDYLTANVGTGKYYSSIDVLLKKLNKTKGKTFATIPVKVFVDALKGVMKNVN